ncbi:MAG: hypothetical protein LBB43_07175 [Spirochaetaceae bacterium]|nr:hypothetical protein [Spirochaetaceae bacterium]
MCVDLKEIYTMEEEEQRGMLLKHSAEYGRASTRGMSIEGDFCEYFTYAFEVRRADIYDEYD